jgi:hypothetical protein
VPLGDVDPNVRRRLRSGSTVTEAALLQALKRRGRPLILSVPIEPLQQHFTKGPRPSGCLRTVNDLFVRTLCLLGRP